MNNDLELIVTPVGLNKYKILTDTYTFPEYYIVTKLTADQIGL